MALGFLSDFGGAEGLGGIAELIKTLSSGRTAKDAYERTVNQGPTQAERESIALYKALLDPDNSLVRRNADQETRTGVEGLLKTLRAAQVMDQRAQSRGRGATFSDPERRDEFIDYAISRGIGGIQSSAMDTARGNIANQAAGLRGFIPVQQQRQQDILKAQNNYGQYQNTEMSEGVDRLMNILRPPQGISMLRQTPYTDRQWNTFLGGN